MPGHVVGVVGAWPSEQQSTPPWFVGPVRRIVRAQEVAATAPVVVAVVAVSIDVAARRGAAVGARRVRADLAVVVVEIVVVVRVVEAPPALAHLLRPLVFLVEASPALVVVVVAVVFPEPGAPRSQRVAWDREVLPRGDGTPGPVDAPAALHELRPPDLALVPGRDLALVHAMRPEGVHEERVAELRHHGRGALRLDGRLEERVDLARDLLLGALVRHLLPDDHDVVAREAADLGDQRVEGRGRRRPEDGQHRRREALRYQHDDVDVVQRQQDAEGVVVVARGVEQAADGHARDEERAPEARDQRLEDERGRPVGDRLEAGHAHRLDELVAVLNHDAHDDDLEEGHEGDRREVVLQVAVRDVVAPLARPHAALGPGRSCIGPRGRALAGEVVVVLVPAQVVAKERARHEDVEHPDEDEPEGREEELRQDREGASIFNPQLLPEHEPYLPRDGPRPRHDLELVVELPRAAARRPRAAP